MSVGDLPPNMEALRFALGGSSGGTSVIRAHDPGFDETSFLSWTEQVHFAVITAMNNLDAEALRQYVAESLYLRLSAQISQTKAHGKPAVQEQPNCDRPAIVRADSNPTFDTIVVRLHPTAATGDQAGSHHDGGPVDWTFQRSSRLTTTAGPPTANTAETCASCGAPLKLDGNGDCVYCHTPAPAAKFDWVLVEMAAAAPDVNPLASVVAGSGRKSHVGLWVILIIIAAVGIPIAAAVLTSSHKTSLSINLPTPAATALGGKTLSVELTLTGAIGLSPSTLDMNDLSLNGGHFGDCPTTPLKTIGLNLTFDDGDQLQGTFTLPAAAKAGTTVDFSPGGAAMLHAIGATGAVADDQTWSLPAGKTGAVTVMVDAAGNGTLTWQGLPSGEPDHKSSDPLSGVATWTCS